MKGPAEGTTEPSPWYLQAPGHGKDPRVNQRRLPVIFPVIFPGSPGSPKTNPRTFPAILAPVTA